MGSGRVVADGCEWYHGPRRLERNARKKAKNERRCALMGYIDTRLRSADMRDKVLMRREKKVLLSQLRGSEQEKDLSVPTNCQGFGRVRHFCIERHRDWSPDPLPNLPAARALDKPSESTLRSQVFQLAACNWNCWYCFVDRDHLTADLRTSRYFAADEILDLYMQEENRPYVIDLSGGQPDLVPEWVLWMAEALERRGLDKEVFLWSDDNLSADYYRRCLTQSQRAYLARYTSYSRVGCFKGYDEKSFSFNTSTSPELFTAQFAVFSGLLNEGLDLYAYVTFTAPPHKGLTASIARFVDRLQTIHPHLPLRTVPLKIEPFTPNMRNLTDEKQEALFFQHEVHHAWTDELACRFALSEREKAICDVPMVT